MKKSWLLIAGIALLLVAAVLMVNSSSNPSSSKVAQTPAPHTGNHTPTSATAKTCRRILHSRHQRRVLDQRSTPNRLRV